MWLLTDEEMLQPIWDMGMRLEQEGKLPTQLDRFRAISQAELRKVAERIRKPMAPSDWDELYKEAGLDLDG